jgi:DNA-binding transcriptional LysR family regulator
VQLLHASVAAIIARYMAEHPKVRVHVEATNRRVDVIEEGFDIALRVRTPPLDETELVVRQLGISHSLMVAAPALFVRRKPPRTLDELAAFPTLSQTRAGEQQVWEFTGPDGRRAVHRHSARLAVDDFPLLLRAAVDGLGIALLPEMIVREDLARRRLVPVLQDYTIAQGIAHAAFASRRGMVPAVRTLLDALAAGFTLG